MEKFSCFLFIIYYFSFILCFFSFALQVRKILSFQPISQSISEEVSPGQNVSSNQELVEWVSAVVLVISVFIEILMIAVMMMILVIMMTIIMILVYLIK